MKKFICVVLILALALPICACGGGENYYQIGETVSTDIFEFTLEEADLAIALNRVLNDSYFTPKKYDAKEDSGNPYVASIGHTMVVFTYTVENINRETSDFNETRFSTAKYNNKQYSAKNFEEGAYYLYENRTVINANGKMETQRANVWYTRPSSGMLLTAGEKESRKACFEIETEVENLTDEFYITVKVPNSKGKKESFTYIVPKRLGEEQTEE